MSKDSQALGSHPLTMIPVIAGWFAIITGVAEVVLLTAASQLLHRYVYYFGAYLLWAIPLANLVIFALLGLLLAALARIQPRLGSLRVAVTACAFVSFLALLFLITQLDKLAAIVLAAGLSFQTGRLAAGHPKFFARLVTVTLAWLPAPGTRKQPAPKDAALGSGVPALPNRRQFLVTSGVTLAGLALGVRAWESFAENRALASLPQAPAGLPNVLLIVLDTVRAQNLSLYGYARRTSPQLERIAKTGVTFARATATASWTLPSHASMFTGRHPHQLTVGSDSSLDETYTTLAEALDARGYQTAGFVSNVWYCSKPSGLGRGFSYYQDFTGTAGQILNGASLVRTLAENEQLRRALGYYEELARKSAPEIRSDFMQWLARRDARRPFFAFLNFFDAHEPYLPPAPFDTLFGPKRARANPRHNVGWKWSAPELQTETDAYDGAIAFLDDQLGQLWDDLQRARALDNTIVIFSSDHGEEFYEHGVVDHGYSLYWSAIHVLLSIVFPGRVPAGLVSTPATLRDIPATVMELAGLTMPDRFPGKSLSRHWNGQSREELILSEISFIPGYPEWYPISGGDMKSLVVGSQHFIRHGDARMELYDLAADPWEKQDLAATIAGRRRIDELNAALQEKLMQS